MCDLFCCGILLLLYVIVKLCKLNIGFLEGLLKVVDVELFFFMLILKGFNFSILLMLNRKVKLFEIKCVFGFKKKSESKV